MVNFFKILFFVLVINAKSQVKITQDFIIDDKKAHFYGSGIISVGVGEIVYQTTNLEGLSSLIGSGAALILTWGKELVWDKRLGYGVYSLMDGLVGSGGAGSGGMGHRVSIDLRYKRKQKELIKLRHSKELLL
ncbi:MAG: hypothetical protein V4547_17740 [Bacteroidota bacterium]